MSVELDVDAACGASLGLDFFEEKEEVQAKPDHHKRIFVPPFYPVQSKNHVALGFYTKESLKAADVFASRQDKKVMKSESELGGKISFKLGPDGATFEGVQIYGTVKDDNGNHVDAQVNYDHESKSADVSVGGGKKSE